MSNNTNDTIKYQLIGELKYNSVFVTHENYKILSDQGFGAKQFKPIDKRKQTSRTSSSSTTTAAAADITTSSSSSKVALLNTPKNNIIDTANTIDSINSNTSSFTLSSPFSLFSPLFSPFLQSSSSSTKNDTDASSLSPILLFDEEAFYLFSNGYLKVTNPDGSIVTSLQIWSKFLEKNDKFPLKYKVYSFFRDQGYVVKTGVHYGIDFAVYRTTPNRCHSEICAMVVDATEPLNIHDDKPSNCQQGWRHISTLTRVMPDVMKLSVSCYVLPKEWSKQKSADTNTTSNDNNTTYNNNNAMDIEENSNNNNDEFLSKIFDDKEKNVKEEGGLWNRLFGQKSSNKLSIDFSTPKCLDELTVRPITNLVRRLVAKSDHYLSIGGTQEKYRKCSILKAPRQERTGKKKRRKRRDHTELRVKSQSKHNKVWKALGKPSVPMIQAGVVNQSDETTTTTTTTNNDELDKEEPLIM